MEEEEDDDEEDEEDRSDRRLALFGALLCLNPSAAQSAVCAAWSSSFRRALPSLSLRNAGGWKASYVTSRAGTPCTTTHARGHGGEAQEG